MSIILYQIILNREIDQGQYAYDVIKQFTQVKSALKEFKDLNKNSNDSFSHYTLEVIEID